MNQLLFDVAKLLYPELKENDIVQKLQTVKQNNPQENDDDIILGLISGYIEDEDDSDEDD